MLQIFIIQQNKSSHFQIDVVFERNDKDKDGKLSRKEFKDMMCNHKK